MRGGRTSWARKILPRRHLLPGRAAAPGCQKGRFYWVSCDGTRLAERSGKSLRGRCRRRWLEFCHVACPWCGILGAGRAAIARPVEIVFRAFDRLRPEVDGLLR